MQRLLALALAAFVVACGSGEPTTQTYDGSATYSGAATGAMPAHVVVFGFPQFCNYPQGPCVGVPVTITTGACSIEATVISIHEESRGPLDGFEATVDPNQTCTLGPETIDISGGTLVSTFTTLSLTVFGNDAASAFFTWTFDGS
jgi:hypothetical protein